MVNFIVKPQLVRAAAEKSAKYYELVNLLSDEEAVRLEYNLFVSQNELAVLNSCLEGVDSRLQKIEEEKLALKNKLFVPTSHKAELLRKEKTQLERKEQEFKEQAKALKAKIKRMREDLNNKHALETELFLLLQDVFSFYYPNFSNTRMSDTTMTSAEMLLLHGNSKQKDDTYIEDRKLFTNERVANQKLQTVQAAVDNIRDIHDQLRKTGQDMRKAHDHLRTIANGEKELISGILLDTSKTLLTKLAAIEPILNETTRHFENAYRGVGLLMQQRRRKDITTLGTVMGMIPQGSYWKHILDPIKKQLAKARLTDANVDKVADEFALNIKRVNICLGILHEIKIPEVQDLESVREDHRTESRKLIEFRSEIFEYAVTLYETTFGENPGLPVKGKNKDNDRGENDDSFAKMIRENKVTGRYAGKTASYIKAPTELHDPSFKGSEDPTKQNELYEPVILPTIEPLTPQSSTFWVDAKNRLSRHLGNIKREREQQPPRYRMTPEPPSTVSDPHHIRSSSYSSELGAPKREEELNHNPMLFSGGNEAMRYLEVGPPQGEEILHYPPSYIPDPSNDNEIDHLNVFENYFLDLNPLPQIQSPFTFTATSLADLRQASRQNVGNVMAPHMLYHQDFDSNYPISSPSPAPSIVPSIPLPPDPKPSPMEQFHAQVVSGLLKVQRSRTPDANSHGTYKQRPSDSDNLPSTSYVRRVSEDSNEISSRRASIVNGPPPGMPLPPPPMSSIPQRGGFVPNIPLPALPTNVR